MMAGFWFGVAASSPAAEPTEKPNVQVAESESGDAKATTVTTQAPDGAPATATTVTVVEKEKEKETNRLTEGANHLLERFVGWLHGFFPEIDDAVFHWIACLVIIGLAIVLRHVITKIIFSGLKQMASKTETTLDDRLFPALEKPAAVLVMLLGIFAALTILPLADETDALLGKAAQVTILGTIIWGMIRAGGAVLDHLAGVAAARKMTVATFMPLIKRVLMVFAVVLGVLIVADSMGAPVKVFLTSLGIGGLAFALAAQDTIANLFGSFVVVIDQPFKVGDTVRIGNFTGMVEEIGLRSTKLRLIDKSIAVIPNKQMATESITNLARFSQRRTEQVIGVTYDTRPQQMNELVEELRRLIVAEEEVDPTSVMVYFRDFSASSLDIWVVYVARSPDFPAYMTLRQRLNLKFMELITARGLSFAFPTQTLHFDGPVAKQLAAAGKGEPAPKE